MSNSTISTISRLFTTTRATMTTIQPITIPITTNPSTTTPSITSITDITPSVISNLANYCSQNTDCSNNQICSNGSCQDITTAISKLPVYIYVIIGLSALFFIVIVYWIFKLCQKRKRKSNNNSRPHSAIPIQPIQPIQPIHHQSIQQPRQSKQSRQSRQSAYAPSTTSSYEKGPAPLPHNYQKPVELLQVAEAERQRKAIELRLQEEHNRNQLELERIAKEKELIAKEKELFDLEQERMYRHQVIQHQKQLELLQNQHIMASQNSAQTVYKNVAIPKISTQDLSVNNRDELISPLKTTPLVNYSSPQLPPRGSDNQGSFVKKNSNSNLELDKIQTNLLQVDSAGEALSGTSVTGDILEEMNSSSSDEIERIKPMGSREIPQHFTLYRK